MFIKMVLPVMLYLKVYSLYLVIKLCTSIITIINTYMFVILCCFTVLIIRITGI